MKEFLKNKLTEKHRWELPRVLLAAAECAPLAKTGGLVDVVGTLPKYLADLGMDARVITPYHRIIKEKFGWRVKHMTDFYIDLGWRHQYVGIEKLVIDGVIVYLVDNESYYGDKIYRGGMPEGEQYAFFARAVAEAIPRLDFDPDVLHCNDWHTAMLPMLLKTQYSHAPQGRLRTLLTIHNIAYQGKFGYDYVYDLLGVDARYYTSEFMELDGCANFLKAGCVFSDRINTVSPTYAEEIRTPWYGERLEGILSARSHELSGILNGIDYTTFDPETDPRIPAHFTVDDRSGKAICKQALIDQLGLSISVDTPIVAMVTRMTAQKGFDLVQCVLDELMATEDMAFVLLGSGDAAYESFMRDAENRHKGRVCAYLGYNENLANQIYAGADFLLMPSGFEPCGLSQMIAMRYGTLPIVRETGGLKDSVAPYNHYTGEGTGFSFANFNAHEMADCIRAAVGLYHDYKGEMEKLIRNAMTADYSFRRSAEAYAALYLDLLPADLSAKHDSLDEAYRSPLGAVETGASVRLSIEDPGRFVSGAVLEVYGDDYEKSFPMEKTEIGFTAEFTAPETAQALWYRFVLYYPDGGTQWLCPGADGQHSAICSLPQEGFRLTVFQKGFQTPDWMKHGVLYQIFPDRFAKDESDTAVKGYAAHKAKDQTVHVHESWDEPVEWKDNLPDGGYAPVDFYGGTLKGIESKLKELKNLGVTVLYLNPIFESASNHRYDTGCYETVDPILGTNEDFSALCEAAKKLGMRVILDGVFAHTGADSKYFNRDKHYPGSGAYNSERSPFRKWYTFDDSLTYGYRCWWNFPELPAVNTDSPEWRKRVVSGKNSFLKQWLQRGAAGWRLDVADELSDDALEEIRRAVKEEDPDAAVLGEVWEDAVTKESYGTRRTYALGGALDSVMNYPLRLALMTFLRNQGDAHDLQAFLLDQRMNYPRPFYYAMMNLTGSHDIERTRTALAIDFEARDTTREYQAEYVVTEEMAAVAAKRQKLIAALQFSLPGLPAIYYGDEVGMQGFCDPFNRAPYHEDDPGMREWYQALASLRNEHAALQTGAAAFFAPALDVIAVLRTTVDGADAFDDGQPKETFLTVVNRADKTVVTELNLTEPGMGLCENMRLALFRAGFTSAKDVFSKDEVAVRDGVLELTLPAGSVKIFKLC